MACSKCHSVGGSQPSSLGPDLATLPKDVSDESLVESVLAGYQDRAREAGVSIPAGSTGG